jgi:hypothetical protein
VKTTRTFKVNSDKCGATCIKLFRKVFVVDLTYYRRGFFGGIHETQSQFSEETLHIDCQLSRIEFDDECCCDKTSDKTSLKPIDGTMRLSWGLLSIRTPFFATKNGFVTEIGNLEFNASPLNLRRASAVVDRKDIPELYRFLSRDNSEVYTIQLELESLALFLHDKPIPAVYVETTEALRTGQLRPGGMIGPWPYPEALKS